MVNESTEYQEPFFSEQDLLEQHCRLLETELAELSSELNVSRGKIATLVLMWSAATKDLARAEQELTTVRGALWQLEQTTRPVGITPEG